MVGEKLLITVTDELYSRRFLRNVSRETEKYAICDVQRYPIDCSNYDLGYVHNKKLSKRYVKDGKGGIKDQTTYLGTLQTGIVIEDTKQLLCPNSYSEIFEVDARTLPLKDQTYRMYTYVSEHMVNALPSIKEDYCNDIFFRLDKHIHNLSQNKRERNGKIGIIAGWDDVITNHLEELFGVDVYLYMSREYNHDCHSNALIHKTATLYHINHFGGNKKVISDDENQFNRTILFWYFEDKIIFKYETGVNNF